MPSPSNRIALAKRDIKQIRKNIRGNIRTRIAEAFSPKKNTVRIISPSTGKAGRVVIGGAIQRIGPKNSGGTQSRITKVNTGFGGKTVDAELTAVRFSGKRKAFNKTVTGRDKTGKEIGYTTITKTRTKKRGKVEITKTKNRKRSLKVFERANRAAQASRKMGTRGGTNITLTPKVKGIRPGDEKKLSSFILDAERPGREPGTRQEIKNLRKGFIDNKTGEFVKGVKQFKQDKRAGRTNVKLRVTAPKLPSGTINYTKKENRLARKNYRKFGTAIAPTTAGKQGNKKNGIERQFGYKPSMLRKKRKNHV